MYEINGDQVAVIFDPPEEVVDGNEDEAKKEQNAKPAVYWVDSMLLIPKIHILYTVWKSMRFNIVFWLYF